MTPSLLLRAVRRGWRFGALLFVLAALAAAAGTYARKPSYESTAAILVNVERLGVSASRADVRQDTAVLQAVEAVSSQAEIIRSRELVEQLAARLDPALFVPRASRSLLVQTLVELGRMVRGWAVDGLRQLALLPPENPHYDLIRRIEGGLSVSAVRQTQVVRVSYRDSDPDTARAVLQGLIDLYLSRNAGQKLDRAEAGVLGGEAARAREELEAAEAELFALRGRHGIADLPLEKATLIERINRLTNALDGVSGASAGVPPAAAALAPRAPDAGLGDAGGGASSPQIAQLRAQLNALRVERAGQLTYYGAGNPRVRQLDDQAARVEALLRAEVARVKEAIAGYQSRLQALLSVEPQLTRLTRNAAILSDSYQVYRKASEDRQLMRQEEARVQLQLIDPPSVPYAPSGPVPALLLLAGLALAAALGLAGAAAFSLLRDARARPDPAPMAVPAE